MPGRRDRCGGERRARSDRGLHRARPRRLAVSSIFGSSYTSNAASPWSRLGPDTSGYTQGSTLYLYLCQDCLFENVTAQGGESAVRLDDCERLLFDKLFVNPQYKGSSRSGIFISGGAGHTFRSTRIRSPGYAGDAGYGVLIANSSASSASHITFDGMEIVGSGCTSPPGAGNPSCYGNMAAQLQIAPSTSALPHPSNILFVQLGSGSPTAPGW